MTARCTFVILLAWTVCVAGCAHYVNIPAQKGDLAYHDPNAKIPRAVMLLALQKVLELRPIEDSFQVVLPVGAVPATYAHILPRISERAMWSSDGRTKDLPLVCVTQVHVRGTRADVDVALPIFAGDAPAVAQITTVHLRYEPMSKWYVVRVREWRHSAERAAPHDD